MTKYTDIAVDNTANVGYIGIIYSDTDLIGAVAKAMRESGRTCDENSWDTVLAWEAVRVLRDMGALK